MLIGTKPEEELSFENINILILVSTSLMIFSCIMEVLTFFLYSNRVNRWANKDMWVQCETNCFPVSSKKRNCGCGLIWLFWCIEETGFKSFSFQNTCPSKVKLFQFQKQELRKSVCPSGCLSMNCEFTTTWCFHWHCLYCSQFGPGISALWSPPTRHSSCHRCPHCSTPPCSDDSWPGQCPPPPLSTPTPPDTRLCCAGSVCGPSRCCWSTSCCLGWSPWSCEHGSICAGEGELTQIGCRACHQRRKYSGNTSIPQSAKKNNKLQIGVVS